jgi:hypothetical protein
VERTARCGIVLALALGVSAALALQGFCADPSEGEALYQSDGRRDPFVPLVRDGRLVSPALSSDKQAKAGVPVLHGILWDSGGRSIALLDDTETQVGGVVREYKITEILQDSVILTSGEKTVTLRLDIEEKKTGTQGSQ